VKLVEDGVLLARVDARTQKVQISVCLPVWTREVGRGLVIDDKSKWAGSRLQTLLATVSLDYIAASGCTHSTVTCKGRM
jgi:hypothetical protein